MTYAYLILVLHKDKDREKDTDKRYECDRCDKIKKEVLQSRMSQRQDNRRDKYQCQMTCASRLNTSLFE